MLTHRSASTTLDALYDGFVAQLLPSLRDAARDLPRRLGLTDRADVLWSAVFDDVTALGLPLLMLSACDRPSTSRIIRKATEAHMLAMIGALGAERRGSVELDSLTVRVLEQVRRHRDAALDELRGEARLSVGYDWADEQTEAATALEREALPDPEGVTWSQYLEVRALDQGLAFPASLVAVRAAGWSADDRRHVYDLVAGAALGRQYRDDAVGWKEDHERGASWPVALGVPEGKAKANPLTPRALEERLHERGTLVRLLEMSREQFQRAADAAAAIGAVQFSGWAAEQARLTERLAQQESRDAGAALRWELGRRAQRSARLRAATAQAMMRRSA